MIFYFSGTGNSYQAALAMQHEGEALVEMTACVREGRNSFDVAQGESIGFVCPVYYGGLPSVVLDFLRELSLSRTPDYCYGVLTCGAKSYGAPEMLSRALANRGIHLRAAFTVVMPDNYVVMIRIAPDTDRDRILSRAEFALRRVRRAVDRWEEAGLPVSAADRLVTKAMYPLYERFRRTKPFFSDEQCVGCGICAGRCPARAIVMENGHPKWVAEKCIHCMSCVRCGAVQYGRFTRGKKRYTNPVLKKASGGHAHHNH